MPKAEKHSRRIATRLRRLSFEALEDRRMLSAYSESAMLTASAHPPIYTSKVNGEVVANIYLEFRGHTAVLDDTPFDPQEYKTFWTPWKTYKYRTDKVNLRTHTAPPFDFDDKPSSFSVEEQLAIIKIAEIVDEDFAPFRVRVTTDPTVYNPARDIRVVFDDDYVDRSESGGLADGLLLKT